MTPAWLLLNFWLFCFCLTGPVGWPITTFIGIGLGWNAGLYYAAHKAAKPTNDTPLGG
jgi:hypothetical protein